MDVERDVASVGRGRAAETLTWTKAAVTRIGLTLSGEKRAEGLPPRRNLGASRSRQSA